MNDCFAIFCLNHQYRNGNIVITQNIQHQFRTIFLRNIRFVRVKKRNCAAMTIRWTFVIIFVPNGHVSNRCRVRHVRNKFRTTEYEVPLLFREVQRVSDAETYPSSNHTKFHTFRFSYPTCYSILYININPLPIHKTYIRTGSFFWYADNIILHTCDIFVFECSLIVNFPYLHQILY